MESFAEQEWVHLGQLGDIMNKRNPDFDARNYGYRNLSAMLESKQDTFELVRGNNIGMSHNLPYVRLKS
ncbi:OST-HTH/LOTUS domain-containing protein [Klebsiella aerogenes]